MSRKWNFSMRRRGMMPASEREFRAQDRAEQGSSVRLVLALWSMVFSLTASQVCAEPASVRLVQQPQPQSLPEVVQPPAGEGKLTLAELKQMALASNPSIARAAALVNAARGNWVQVGLLPNPSVGYEGQQLGSGGVAEQQGVLFSQEFVRGNKLRLNRAVAAQELSRAEQQLAAQEQRVLTDVQMAYFQALLAQRQIDLSENLMRIGRQGVETVNALLQAKEASRADSLQAKIEVENAQILVQNARNRHGAAWQSLAAVAGNPQLRPQPLAGDAFAPPQEIDFQQALARIQSNSPEIAAAVTEIDRARMNLERARVEPVPNITVQGLVNVIDNGVSGKPDAGVTVSLPIPVFNKNQGAILKADQELIAAQRALVQLELDLQNRLAPTFERYANARNQVERYRTVILPSATESLDLTRSMFEAGETNYMGLLVAQRTYFQINISYLEAVRALRLAEAEIEGLLLFNSLQGR